MGPLTTDRLLRLRLAAQGLCGPAPADVAEAARRAGGVQAQAAGPARLAVRARTSGLTAGDVDAACAEPTVVRSWLMRGTLHMVAVEELRRLLAVFGPVNARAGRRRRDQLGLTDQLCEQALAAIADVLAGGRALTRADLITELADHGVAVEPKTQAPAHLLLYAASRGLICRGPEAAADEPTYVLLDDWLGPAPEPVEREDALAGLAAGYFAAYGPATPADFTAWSGLPAADTRAALARLALDELTGPDGETLLAHPAARKAGRTQPDVHLLGQFDPYLLGHRTRDLILDPAHARRVNKGGGMISPVVLVGGRVAGTWRLDRSRALPRFALDWFGTAPPPARGDRLDAALDAEIADIARFLGLAEYQRA